MIAQYCKRLCVLMMLLFLASCTLLSKHYYPIDSHSLNDPEHAWTSDPDAVVVLLGMISDQQVEISFYESLVAGQYRQINLWGERSVSPIAFRFKTGDSARLREVFLGGTSYGLRYTQQVLKFDDTPVLKLDKPGIYYYGTLVVKDKKGAYSKDYRKDVIDGAKKRYPDVFANMKPVNF